MMLLMTQWAMKTMRKKGELHLHGDLFMHQMLQFWEVAVQYISLKNIFAL